MKARPAVFDDKPLARLDATITLKPLAVAGAAIGALTVLRLLFVALSPWELSQDEAQYWFWSQHPAFGYFSKPPLIAWLIGATTGVFGDTEFGVRVSTALFHGGTALILAALAKRLFGAREAVAAALIWALAPAVSISTHLMSTDVPLLMFWSGALYVAYAAITSEKPNWPLGLFFGALFGLGFLAKYAMIYFPIGLGAAMAASSRLRRPGAVALLAAPPVIALLIAPNVLWNQQHAFSTLSHTAANADWSSELFNIDKLALFLGGQFIVFGPIAFAALLWAAWSMRERLAETADADRRAKLIFLIAMAAPPLIIVSLQAFLSRAHANWAATAYPAASVLLSALLLARPKVLAASLGANALAFSIVTFCALAPGVVERESGAAPFTEVRGWREQATAIAAVSDGYDVVLADDRALMAALYFYAPGMTTPVMAWDPNRSVDHHFEAFYAYEPRKGDRALFPTYWHHENPPVRRAFDRIERVGEIAAPAGTRGRKITLLELSEVRDDAWHMTPPTER